MNPRRTDQFQSVTELTVLSPRHHGFLFALLRPAATGNGIVGAQIFTTSDGMALDSIVISAPSIRTRTGDAPGRTRGAAIEQALKGEVRIARSSTKRRPAKERPRDLPRGTSASRSTTFIESASRHRGSGLDRPEALCDLAALGKLASASPRPISRRSERGARPLHKTDLTGTGETTDRQARSMNWRLRARWPQSALPLQQRTRPDHSNATPFQRLRRVNPDYFAGDDDEAERTGPHRHARRPGLSGQDTLPDQLTLRPRGPPRWDPIAVLEAEKTELRDKAGAAPSHGREPAPRPERDGGRSYVAG